MKCLVIIDLNKDNINHIEENCNYLNVNSGKIRLNKSKELLLKNLKRYDVRSRKFLSIELKKKLAIKNSTFYQQLEIFNLRNDKILSISKIINFLKLNFFINDSKFSEIKVITDNSSTIDIIKSFDKKIKIISYAGRELKLNFSGIKIIKFYVKAFFLVTFIKFFPSHKNKIKNELGMTIYPNFFNDENEIFYNSKQISKLNFLLTDETHLGHSFLQIIRIYKKIKNKNILFAEEFIGYLDIFKGLFESLYKLLYLKNKNNSFYIGKINFSNFYIKYFYSSFINRCKLEIYNSAIPKVLKKYNTKIFHLYLFEYNFGFFLINIIKKLNIYVKGYQHGIFSSKLYWYDIILQFNHNKFFPHEIIANNNYSYKEYKKQLKKRVKISFFEKKKSSFLSTLKFKKKVNNQKILILTGTHDVIDFYNFVKEKIKINKKDVYFFKLHPKNKFIFQSEKNLKIIEKVDKISFNKIIVSSTSTLIYDFKKTKIPIEIFNPDYKVDCY